MGVCNEGVVWLHLSVETGYVMRELCTHPLVGRFGRHSDTHPTKIFQVCP